MEKKEYIVQRYKDKPYISTDYIRKGIAITSLQSVMKHEHALMIEEHAVADHIIMLITGGGGEITVNGKVLPVSKGDLIVLLPSEFIALHLNAGSTGWMLCSTTQFLLGNEGEDLGQRNMFFIQMLRKPVNRLNNDDLASIETLFRLMNQESLHAEDDYKQLITTLFVRLSMALIARAFQEVNSAGRNSDNLLFERFYNLVVSRYTDRTTTKEYAQALAVSTRSLSRCTRRILGLTPIEIHNRRLLAEVCSLLRHTTLPIAEILILLRRDTASNFTRFFKDNTGLSPSEYRRRYSSVIGVQR